MNNVHPLFRDDLVPPTPATMKVLPDLRPFAVAIWIAGKPRTISVLAFTTCDAICNAIDIFFDGDEPMPIDGLKIEAHPENLLPSAA